MALNPDECFVPGELVRVVAPFGDNTRNLTEVWTNLTNPKCFLLGVLNSGELMIVLDDDDTRLMRMVLTRFGIGWASLTFARRV